MAKKVKKITKKVKKVQSEVTILRNAALNAVTSRTALLKKMLDPRRDLDAECGYVADPNQQDYDDMYTKEGIARRVVHILPEESWQVDPLVFEDETDEVTDFEAKWVEVEEKHDIYSFLARSDILSGIGRFGVILLGFDDGGKLEAEVKAKEDMELLYLRTFDETVVKIKRTEERETNERFGKPTCYTIEFSSPVEGIDSSQSKEVHWTRIVHLADNRRMDEMLGVPRMRPVFNRLQDLRKLLGGSAEMFWQGAFPGLAFEVDPRLLEEGMVDIDTDALKEQMQDYINGLQRYLATTGVSVKTLAPTVSDPSNHITAQLKAIAITIGVPYRVFMGTEEGKLAGGQDADAWSRRLAQRQNKYLTPYVVRPFIQALVKAGVLPEPTAINIRWPSMMEPSEKEQADVAKTITEAIKAYVQGDVSALMPPRYYLIEVLGFEAEVVDAMLNVLTAGIIETDDDEPPDEEEDDNDEEANEE